MKRRRQYETLKLIAHEQKIQQKWHPLNEMATLPTSLFGAQKETKLRGLSSQVNYTDQATAACLRS
jgi:hypothetical protein